MQFALYGCQSCGQRWLDELAPWFSDYWPECCEHRADLMGPVTSLPLPLWCSLERLLLNEGEEPA